MSELNNKKVLVLQRLLAAVSMLQDGPDVSDLFHAADTFDESWDLAIEVDGQEDGNNIPVLDELVHDVLTFYIGAESTANSAQLSYVAATLPDLLNRIKDYFDGNS